MKQDKKVLVAEGAESGDGELQGPGLVGTVVAGGQRWSVGKDGRLWRQTEGLGVAWVPVAVEQFRKMTGRKEDEDGEPLLEDYDRTRVPDVGWLLGVRKLLETRVSGESVAYMARRQTEEGEWEWKAVVPPQEASAGHFSMKGKKEIDAIHERLLGEGYESVGHLHVHPKGMVSCSVVDIQDWEEMPGVYVVAPRDTGEFGVYVSVGGVVFDVGKLDAPKKGAKVVVEGPEGEAEWWLVIRPPVLKVVDKRGWLFNKRGVVDKWDGRGERTWEDVLQELGVERGKREAKSVALGFGWLFGDVCICSWCGWAWRTGMRENSRVYCPGCGKTVVVAAGGGRMDGDVVLEKTPEDVGVGNGAVVVEVQPGEVENGESSCASMKWMKVAEALVMVGPDDEVYLEGPVMEPGSRERAMGWLEEALLAEDGREELRTEIERRKYGQAYDELFE